MYFTLTPTGRGKRKSRSKSPRGHTRELSLRFPPVSPSNFPILEDIFSIVLGRRNINRGACGSSTHQDPTLQKDTIDAPGNRRMTASLHQLSGETRMPNRIPLVYILSSGRSGTTLLDMLLNTHPSIWSVGEAQILPWELKNQRAPCGCGDPIPEDDFWKPLLPEIPLDTQGYHIGYFRNEDQTGRVLRWNLLRHLFQKNSPGGNPSAIEEYGQNNRQYFRLILESARKRTGQSINWLVDNSKDPYRLLWLKKSNQFDLRVIHLVKDPRAFVYSMTKDRLPNALNKVIRFAGRWIVEYVMMRALCRNHFLDGHTRMLRYEDLAREPVPTVQSLGRWLGLSLEESRIQDFRSLENHAISGNMMRWRKSETEIELDRSWQERLPTPYQYLVHGMTLPLLASSSYTLPR